MKRKKLVEYPIMKKIIKNLLFFFSFVAGTFFSFICFYIGLAIVTGIIIDVNPCLFGAHKGEWTVVTPATCTADGKEETSVTTKEKAVAFRVALSDTCMSSHVEFYR